MLFGTLGATLLENMLAGKDVIRAGKGRIRAERYYQNEPKLNGLYSRHNLPKTNDGTCVKNLDEYKSIETHWIVLNVNVI